MMLDLREVMKVALSVSRDRNKICQHRVQRQRKGDGMCDSIFVARQFPLAHDHEQRNITNPFQEHSFAQKVRVNHNIEHFSDCAASTYPHVLDFLGEAVFPPAHKRETMLSSYEARERLFTLYGVVRTHPAAQYALDAHLWGAILFHLIGHIL